MRTFVRALLLALTVCAGTAWGQTVLKEPHLGYLYPSGGQQGTVFRITAGGQHLKGVSGVHVTGEGVRASITLYAGQIRRLNRMQRGELAGRLIALADEQGYEFSELVRARLPGRLLGAKGGGDKRGTASNRSPESAEATDLPRHPLLNNLENLGPSELEFVANEFLRVDKKKQQNMQIGELALIEVTIDPDAAPGDRELRLNTPFGLTNPMCFQVGVLPETCEQEPYDSGTPVTTPVVLPILLNGQIKPGDADRFCFYAQQGRKLVIEAKARHLIPYLADAVPGWFQATLALYDVNGTEMAFADDYRFEPDPVLRYEVQKTGLYELEIRDSIYRGRDDFVYRIALGEQPFIRSGFPPDTLPSKDSVREAALLRNGSLLALAPCAADALEESNETEPNDSEQEAQRISLPGIVSGCIGEPGDVDVFRFKGRRNSEVVAEVYARRLRSPLDSLLRLIDASGQVLEWNDDHEHKDGYLHRDAGLLTHHADSYLRVRLPKSGEYRVSLADSQRHGGEEYEYRLRISPPQPDFALRVTPASINLRAGFTVPICAYAMRKDGFDGDIELSLKDAPAGFNLRGGRILSGCDRVRMTLTAPGSAFDYPVAIVLEGHALIDGKTVNRPVAPSENMMQAFLYRHLVPCDELLVAVRKAKIRMRSIEPADSSPARIPKGGTSLVRINTPRHRRVMDVELKLNEPPDGVTLQEVTVVPGGLELVLKADGDTARTGDAGNLIVDIFIEKTAGSRSKGTAQKTQRVSLGVLPAIPYEIVRR